MSVLEEFEARFPLIRWREPIRVTVVGAPTVSCCRVCIALHGLHSEDVAERSFQGYSEFREHLLTHLEEPES